SFADPGIRVQEFTQAFGSNGLVYSICQDNFGPALNSVAMKLSTLVGPAWLQGPFADKDRNPSNGVQPACTVIDRVPRPVAAPIDTPVPACTENGNVAPCWMFATTPACTAGSSQLTV